MVTDTPVYGLDWLPTLANMMDFKLPTDRTYDGQSLVPLLKDKTLKRQKPLIFGIDMPFRTIRRMSGRSATATGR